MTDNTDPKSEVEIPTGFTDVSGPAAFKAKLAAQEASNAALEPEPVPGLDGGAANPALEEKVRGLEAALLQSNDQLLRTVAEMENLRKRSAREREDASKYAVSSFARDLLDVADNFRRALDAIPAELRGEEKIKPLVEGIEATERTLLKTFEKNGIRKIEPLDEPFNPNFHEVMFEAPVPGKAPGTIMQIIEVGYVLNDRLLRAAKVGITKATDTGEPLHHIDTQA